MFDDAGIVVSPQQQIATSGEPAVVAERFEPW
jgi:hypothetical protein